MDDRLEKDGRGEKGRGEIARSQGGRDDRPVGRDVRRHCGGQDDGSEGVHDGRAQDEREYDARDETRWRPQGMCTYIWMHYGELTLFFFLVCHSEHEGQGEALKEKKNMYCVASLARQTRLVVQS